MDFWPGLPVLAFLTLALVVPGVAGFLLVILGFSGAIIYINRRSHRYRVFGAQQIIIFAFLFYFLTSIGAYIAGPGTELSDSLLRRDARFALAALAAITVSHCYVNERLRIYALVFGAIAASVVAALEVLWLTEGSARASGATISIVFGHLSSGLFAVLVFLLLEDDIPARRILIWIGILCAILAVLLSGARGAYVSVSVIIVVAVVLAAMKGSRLLVWLLSFVVIFSGLLIMLFPNLQNRVDRMLVAMEYQFSQRDAAEMPMSVGCNNDRVFLDFLIESGRSGGKGVIEVRVLSSEKLVGSGCPSDLAIHFSNSSTGENAWFYFPERSVSSDNEGGVFLVRGKASFALKGVKGPLRNSVDSKDWVEITPTESGHVSTEQLVMLEPGDSVAVIPWITNPGEYSFSSEMNSIALRIQMGSIALQAFKDSPLLGHGLGSYPEVAEAAVDRWRAPAPVSAFDHAHSDFSNISIERGLLGLLALLILYSAPLFVAIKSQGVLATGAVGFIISFAVSGATETMFNHSIGITYYAVVLLILLLPKQSCESEPAVIANSM